MTGRVVVGMAGWVYPPWRGDFYPRGLVQKNELAYASTQVTSIELNSSFYALPTPSSWRTWRDATPQDFVFSVKAPKLITQMKRLRNVSTDVSDFFASGLLALGPKLGAILWQLPPDHALDLPLLERFLDLLPHSTTEAVECATHRSDRMIGREHLDTDADRPVRHALEVRHHSFATDAVLNLLTKHGIAAVLGDSGGKWPVIDQATAGFRYARLHADEAIYPGGCYEPADLDRWAATIRNWVDAGQDAYVYFDNDAKTRAPIDAVNLLARLRT
ncbi:DUF72 domain-containing protein [soil metagenome]